MQTHAVLSLLLASHMSPLRTTAITEFHGCPAIDVSSMSKEAFWKLMLEDPLPRRLVSPDFPKVILMDTLSPTHA